MDCPATINVVHLMRFPEYKISVNNEKGKREASQQLKQALKDDQCKVKTVELFAAYFPKIEEHQNHPVLGQGVDPPPPTRRRFYPLDKDIWNIIQRTKASTRRSNIDQVNLQSLVDTWTQQDIHIVYRPSEEQDDGSVTKLLFCLQTSWQQRLLLLTNVNYVIVGVFFTQSESPSDIKEALQTFKDWNPDWKPSHFMVDFYSKVILCDFHREKAWVEWTRKGGNGVCSQDEVLRLLRDIAHSHTEEEFKRHILVLQTNTNWLTNERLRRWFNTKWLPRDKRWVNVYKTKSLKVAIYTNNGVERQNKTLKHTFLEGYKNCSLSELLTVVVSDFLSKAYQKYIELNVMFSDGYRKYNTNLPQYLQNRPRAIAQHILDRHFRSLDFKGAVTGREKGVFCVKSLTTSATHLVSLATAPSVHHVPAKTEDALVCKEDTPSTPVCTEDTPNTPDCTEDTPNTPDCTEDTPNTPDCTEDTPNTPDCTEDTPNTPDCTEDTHSKNSGNHSKSSRDRKRQQCGTLLREITEHTYHLQDETFMCT
ncbi:Ribosome-binding protein 1, partial [Dissostichus eleginoides]